MLLLDASICMAFLVGEFGDRVLGVVKK
ncbi:uncharacterized protein METZ01_LOCUS255366 [marine metagenome]|uniref:Uncharacterized protein n=1 Tax=marine metagenome TaxID=408172 RepID=A0A382ITH5_9ZZZZ